VNPYDETISDDDLRDDIENIDMIAETGAVDDVRACEDDVEDRRCVLCDEPAELLVVSNGGEVEGHPICEVCTGEVCEKCGGEGIVVRYHRMRLGHDSTVGVCDWCDGEGYLVGVGRSE